MKKPGKKSLACYLPVILLVPFGEVAEAGSQWNKRRDRREDRLRDRREDRLRDRKEGDCSGTAERGTVAEHRVTVAELVEAR